MTVQSTTIRIRGNLEYRCTVTARPNFFHRSWRVIYEASWSDDVDDGHITQHFTPMSEIAARADVIANTGRFPVGMLEGEIVYRDTVNSYRWRGQTLHKAQLVREGLKGNVTWSVERRY